MRESGLERGLGRPFGGEARSWPPVPRLWPGETICIIASGPSACRDDAEFVRGKCRVIVVNTSYRLAPWADLLYACDAKWWWAYEPQFQGLTVSQDARAPESVLRVPSINEPGLSLDPMVIHQGGNSGYQALNLAVLLGVRRILLLGYDMQGGDHWHGAHPPGLVSLTDKATARWRENFGTTLPDLERANVEVVNCSRQTALTCFPRMSFEDALA
ncbi:MAG TPA: hypothetical protein VKA19_14055 [Alphaproteobacteria bacterium]|nr:hypothetical protein [Alphaproteobacteria bacterium]